jgi:N-methylhydantoinase A
MEINVDIGGTFTDCFAARNGSVASAKALTTHHDLAQGFMTAVEDLAREFGTTPEELLHRTEAIRYATTLGTNALIERTGPRLGLITTMGYEDVVPIGRCRSYGEGLPAQEFRNLARAQRPEPLVPREYIVGIRERVDSAGRVVMPIDEAEVRDRVLDLVDKGVRGFVVSFLWSFKNPTHERVVREVIEEEFPGAYLGRFPVILAHEVSRLQGEYVRTMTSILDAYLHQYTGDRMSQLRDELRSRGYKGSLQIVHNSGGMGSLSRTTPLQTIHAGPVAGLYGSRHMADRFDYGKVVTTDMGGTSFDIGVVVKGSVRFYEFNPVIDRWLVQMPMMDIKAVGAGGGSIATHDSYHGLRVGPRSAGSNPGPACYGQGGQEPTVTDANLLLGYLNADYYHGGSLKLDTRRAERSIERRIAGPMGLSAEEAAAAIRQVVDSNMGDAIFKEIVLKGYDPRDFAIFSFGGGGPLHACGYAEVLDIGSVVIPPFAPVFSASGAAGLDLLHIYNRSEKIPLYNPLFGTVFDEFGRIDAILEEFAAQAREDFADEGHSEGELVYQLELDLRSGGQLYVTTIKSPVLRIRSKGDLAAVLKAYFAEYADRFGDFALTSEVGVSLETLRMRVSVPRPAWEPPELGPSDGGSSSARKGARECWWAGEGRQPTHVYDLDLLGAGDRVEGPSILEGADTTVLVNPGWTGEMDSHAFLTLKKEASR